MAIASLSNKEDQSSTALVETCIPSVDEDDTTPAIDWTDDEEKKLVQR